MTEKIARKKQIERSNLSDQLFDECVINDHYRKERLKNMVNRLICYGLPAVFFFIFFVAILYAWHLIKDNKWDSLWGIVVWAVTGVGSYFGGYYKKELELK